MLPVPPSRERNGEGSIRSKTHEPNLQKSHSNLSTYSYGAGFNSAQTRSLPQHDLRTTITTQYHSYLRDLTLTKPPRSLFKFIQSPIYSTFVATCTNYFIALADFRHTQHDVDPQGTSQIKGIGRKAEVAAAVEAKCSQVATTMKQRKHDMGAAYARVLLQCSNYERNKSDQLFFECLYRVTLLVLTKTLSQASQQFESLVQYMSPAREVQHQATLFLDLYLLFRPPYFSQSLYNGASSAGRIPVPNEIQGNGDKGSNLKEVVPLTELLDAISEHAIETLHTTAFHAKSLVKKNAKRNSHRKLQRWNKKTSVYKAMKHHSPLIADLLGQSLT